MLVLEFRAAIHELQQSSTRQVTLVDKGSQTSSNSATETPVSSNPLNAELTDSVMLSYSSRSTFHRHLGGGVAGWMEVQLPALPARQRRFAHLRRLVRCKVMPSLQEILAVPTDLSQGGRL